MGIFKSLFDVKSWLGWPSLKAQTALIVSTVRSFFLKTPAVVSFSHCTSFEEAMQKVGFTEKDLQKRLALCKKELSICITAFFLFVGYAIFLFYKKKIMLGVITGGLIAILGCKFMTLFTIYYQIHSRQLHVNFFTFLSSKFSRKSS